MLHGFMKCVMLSWNCLLCFDLNKWKWFVYFYNSTIYNMLVLQTLQLIYLANDVEINDPVKMLNIMEGKMCRLLEKFK